MNREYISRLETMLNRSRIETTILKRQQIKDKLAIKKLQLLVKEFAKSNFELKGNLNLEKEKYLCNICYNRTKNIIMVPCYHFVSCKTCSSKLEKCPMCRRDIEYVLQLYG